MQTPNPWLGRFRSGFIVKPVVKVAFHDFTYCFIGRTHDLFPCFFNAGLHLHKGHYKTSVFDTFFNVSRHLHREHYKTIVVWQLGCLGSYCKGVIRKQVDCI